MGLVLPSNRSPSVISTIQRSFDFRHREKQEPNRVRVILKRQLSYVALFVLPERNDAGRSKRPYIVFARDETEGSEAQNRRTRVLG